MDQKMYFNSVQLLSLLSISFRTRPANQLKGQLWNNQLSSTISVVVYHTGKSDPLPLYLMLWTKTVLTLISTLLSPVSRFLDVLLKLHFPESIVNGCVLKEFPGCNYISDIEGGRDSCERR